MKLICQSHYRRAGIVLIECMVYIAAFAVVLTLAFASLHRTWLTSKALRRNAGDITAALHAGEQWRTDIRQAVAPIEIGDADGVSSVRIRTGTGTILYRLIGNELRRESTVPAADYIVLENVKASAMFAETQRHVTVWRWELELKSKQPKAKLRPLFSFIAVPSHKIHETP